MVYCILIQSIVFSFSLVEITFLDVGQEPLIITLYIWKNIVHHNVWVFRNALQILCEKGINTLYQMYLWH